MKVRQSYYPDRYTPFIKPELNQAPTILAPQLQAEKMLRPLPNHGISDKPVYQVPSSHR